MAIDAGGFEARLGSIGGNLGIRKVRSHALAQQQQSERIWDAA